MSTSAFTGPIIVSRDNPYSGTTNPVGQAVGTNPDEGPSMFHMAMALLDPRPVYTYEQGQAQYPQGFNASGVAISGGPTLGWLSATFQVADYTPGTAATFSLASIGTAITASTTVTLTATAQNGVTPGSTCTNAATGATVTGLWQIDNIPSGYTFGTGTYGVWDPANPPIGRCISIATATSNTMSATTFTITGYDAYGYPITQVMQGPGGGATTFSSKAFKWVSGITVGTTAATNTFSIGVSDTYGFPLYSQAIGYIRAFWANSNVKTSAATTFTAGSAAILTTSSDVRGTIGLAGLTASNGVRKLQMWQSVAPSNLTVGSLFGTSPPA